MVLVKVLVKNKDVSTSTLKRKLRRKRLRAAKAANKKVNKENKVNKETSNCTAIKKKSCIQIVGNVEEHQPSSINNNNFQVIQTIDMSSKEVTDKSREDVKAAREAKKLAKQKAKSKAGVDVEREKNLSAAEKTVVEKDATVTPKKDGSEEQFKENSPKSKDEVDRAINVEAALQGSKSKEIAADRAGKKAAKQAKKKGPNERTVSENPDMTVKDVVETLRDIKNLAKDVQDITAKVSAISFEAKKPPATTTAGSEEKSKADLKAERRAKQEAQRAAKQAAEKAAKAKAEPAKPKAETSVKSAGDLAKEKSPKPKGTEKTKSKSSTNRINWFQHLYTEHDKDSLNKIPINSHLHPAIVKLGVQLATRVVSGSNARCVALLDALKKMVRDYTLPAKTEFSRGLEAHLAQSLDFLWSMRQPSASQTNAVKYFRHHLTQLPNNVDEFDAKKTLQEEIDKYIEDQIDKAGEAISMTVQKKISNGDTILTYGCSSLIERILREAWEAKLRFRTVVVGNRVHGHGREMLRRLVAAGLPCAYVDVTAVSHVMSAVDLVVLGCAALLASGSVLGALGTAQAALAARARNVPVLVACETHKVSERVQTDAFVYNEIGDPDELIDKSDDNSPLKDWRSNPNLTPLNLTYDVTPPSLVTAVVTEKAILPCTSAPVVLRTKLSEYGM